MTKKEFKSSEPLRVELAMLLQNPTLVLALSILKDDAIPSKGKMPQPVQGVHYDTTLAHQFHEFVGVQSVLTKLTDMTFSNTVSEPKEEREYEHALPDILKKK